MQPTPPKPKAGRTALEQCGFACYDDYFRYRLSVKKTKKEREKQATALLMRRSIA